MSKLDELRAELSQLRDEAKVRAELGRMEAKERWEEAEAKWNHFIAEARFHQSKEGIMTAFEELGEELRTAYGRIIKAL